MGSRYNHRSRGYGAPLRSHAFLRACYTQIRFLVNLSLRLFKFSGVDQRPTDSGHYYGQLIFVFMELVYFWICICPQYAGDEF